MAQRKPNLTLKVDAQWLALHEKHEQEIRKFMQAVAADRASFEARVEAARSKLLARHMGEENEFWRTHPQGTGATTTATTPKPIRSHLSNSKLSTSTPTTPTTPASQPRPLRTSEPLSKVPQVANQARLAPTPPKHTLKNPTTEVIDLCDSDEEIAPAERPTSFSKLGDAQSTCRVPTLQQAISQQRPSQSSGAEEHADEMRMDQTSTPAEPTSPTFLIPSATFQLFSSTPTYSKSTCGAIRIKDEKIQPDNSSMISSSASSSSLSRMGFANEHLHDADILAKRPSPVYRVREQPSGILGKQYHDRSAILKESIPLARNHTIFAPKQQNHIEGSSRQSWQYGPIPSCAPDLCNALNSSVGYTDVEISEGSRPAKGPAVLSNMSTNPCQNKHGSIGGQPIKSASVLLQEHMPESVQVFPLTPPHSQSSHRSEPSPGSTDLHERLSFKKPTTPASSSHSVHQSSTSEARKAPAGTNEPRTPSFNLPATSSRQRSASVIIGLSETPSRATQTRKRVREIILSSDEDESDYTPSEPDSSSPKQSTREHRGPQISKKAKVHRNLCAENLRGKNSFGFKVKTRPSVPSTPPTPPKTPSTTSRPATAFAPGLLAERDPAMLESPFDHTSLLRGQSASKSKPDLPRAPVSRKFALDNPLPPTGKRRAALAAENRIHGYFEETEQLATECAIDDANQREEARLPEDVRRMSVIPSSSPSNDQSVDAEDGVERIDHAEPHGGSGTSSGSLKPKSPCQFDNRLHERSKNSWSSWTQARLSGDRHLSKFQATIVDDADEPTIDYDIKSDRSWMPRK
ncbi:hypothetical protein FB567DRAFT_187140 [Paraphoma chrysanthemicola]|uniref:Uncharacterized protein n=1 Tax=Paraphoma chrysanthemicola TaxID=798071 RepID=A0A8K0QWY9_9PLEO|nr:hypothetical protein FB567DRAFT_187140 [Paraphoma chrysanthemicola]